MCCFSGSMLASHGPWKEFMRSINWLTISVAMLLAVPMLRQCCVIPTEATPSHCHESGRGGTSPCYLNHDAAVVNKSAAVLLPLEHRLAIGGATDFLSFQIAGSAPIDPGSADARTWNLYLRTGELRI